MASEQVRDAPPGSERHAKPCFTWPRDEAFLDLSKARVQSDGRARCTALALCDLGGNPSLLFEQGQLANVFFEFEILEPMAGPVFGAVELQAPGGVVAHGKNSFMADPPALSRVEAGQRVRFHYVMDLTLGTNEYTLGVGLASADAEAMAEYLDGARSWMSFAPTVEEHVRADGIVTFLVGFGRNGGTSHHGIADVPTKVYVSTLGAGGSRREAPQTKPVLPGPTILHVTHWKAGSQWINKILHGCVPERIVEPTVGEMQFLHRPILAGGVYPTVYVTKQQFDSVAARPDWRHFVVIRDLRDTLVSGYFSVKVSHAVIEIFQPTLRLKLQKLDLEEGLLCMMEEWLPPCARIQISWLEAGETMVKYEDLLTDDIGVLEPLLIDRCGLPVSRELLRKVVADSRFEKVAGGRKRGEENVGAHERKGIAGDWQNHFTPRVKQAFKLRYGALLIATGYERDFDW